MWRQCRRKRLLGQRGLPCAAHGQRLEEGAKDPRSEDEGSRDRGRGCTGENPSVRRTRSHRSGSPWHVADSVFEEYPVARQRIDASRLLGPVAVTRQAIGAQSVDRAADLVIADMLEAKLEGCDIATVQRFLKRDQKIRRRELRRRNKIKATIAQAAFSSACFHLPKEARLFIKARWAKAALPAARLSTLPLQAFCGAACKARP